MQNAQLQTSTANPKLAKIAGTKLTPARVKALREHHQLSLQQFADLFHWSRLKHPYTAKYIYKIETRRTPITRGFEQNFYCVREQLRGQPIPARSVAAEAEIIADFVLPKRLHVIPTPRKCERPRCPVCLKHRTRWFIPRTPNQRKHVLKARRNPK